MINKNVFKEFVRVSDRSTLAKMSERELAMAFENWYLDRK